jgi:hypothetical protein
VLGLLKFWILPLCVMHMNVRKFFTQKEAATLLLFPQLAQESYSSICEKVKKIPFYNIDKALTAINVVPLITPQAAVASSFYQSLCIFVENLCSLVPSHYFMCELLYWRKRDILLEIVLIMSLILIPLHYHEIVPPQV